MLFLFNDVVLELGQPLEALEAEDFPISKQAFAKMSLVQITTLVRQGIFEDLQLPRTQPEKARVLAIMLAVRTGAANAVLVGPPATGASTPAEIGLRLAEVSLVTLSYLNHLQSGGTLTPQQVYRDVWQALYDKDKGQDT